MILNNDLFRLINTFKDVIERIKITHPISGAIDSSRSMVVFLDVSRFESEPVPTFGLAKTKEFLDLIYALANPTLSDLKLELNDGVFTIFTKNTKCKYLTSHLDLFKREDVPVKLLEVIKNTPPIFDFILTVSDLEKIKKISALLNLENMIFTNNAITVNSDISHSDFRIELEGDFVKEPHEVLVSMSHLRKLPNVKYRVRVLQHKHSKEHYMVWLTPADTSDDIINIIIAMKSQD